MNFTANYVQNFKSKIKDSLGNPLGSVYYDSNSKIFRFKNPILVYDILIKNPTKKEPVVRTVTDLKEIENLGFVMCIVPINKDAAWIRMQRTMYALFKKNSLEAQGYKKISSKKINRSGGDLHAVEVDDANLTIRLIGPKAGPAGVGPWHNLE